MFKTEGKLNRANCINKEYLSNNWSVIELMSGFLLFGQWICMTFSNSCEELHMFIINAVVVVVELSQFINWFSCSGHHTFEVPWYLQAFHYDGKPTFWCVKTKLISHIEGQTAFNLHQAVSNKPKTHIKLTNCIGKTACTTLLIFFISKTIVSNYKTNTHKIIAHKYTDTNETQILHKNTWHKDSFRRNLTCCI